MDEAELCQRVGFISQGRLVALDTPEKLKETRMKGYVLEIGATDPDRAIRILKAAQTAGKMPFDEVALYGSTIHVVVPDQNQFQKPVRDLLVKEDIQVTSVEWIAPTLEDVFISTVKS
jgi:ABC-2 type transport system ATP-binding protein